jgi:predicted AAA+ superfamily ATPase
MSENDFQEQIEKITKRAVNERKEELAQEEAMKREARRTANAESKMSSKQKEKESTPYTAVIIAKLEYEGANIPSKEQLAEDLGRNIMKWADQKGFYSINPEEPVPKLISVDVDIK